MISILLITIPFLSGIISFFTRSNVVRRSIIAFCSGVYLVLTCLAWVEKADVFFGGWFVPDDIGLIFLTITAILFFGAALYGVRYLADESRLMKNDEKTRKFFSHEAVFSGCFLIFLSTMTIVIVSQHIAILWVGIEATTLASAPLIYFHRTKQSLEATWKYLLICSVGIAVALMGVFFLAVANNNQGDLFLIKITENAEQMNIPWLKAAFLLLLVGYGTKMGLAPFHTWLPDAHSEAPSVVSALLSGALLNCAFLGILRGYQICIAAGLGAYCREMFIIFGLLSIFFAAVFILGQKDYKRMLAYSSVEHMGILTVGIGLGASAVFGTMVNMIGHALTKAALFLVAGNILSCFKTKKISDIRGLIAGKTYLLGILWISGFFLITGTPPSGIFLGKLIILKEALFQGRYWVVFVFLITLAIVFIGMARIFISMTQEMPFEEKTKRDTYDGNSFLRLCVPALFFIVVIGIGLYFPAWLTRVLKEAAKSLGGF